MFSFWGAKTTKSREQEKHRKTKKKRMNCSPIVAGKTVTMETCMTGDILQKIKSDYNHTHRDDPIRAQDSKSVLAELKKRLSQCSQEDCWLRQIKDAVLRKKIEKYIYAPKHPKEWKYNPNEWLSNYDIFNVLTQWEDAYPEFEFIGPTFIDFDAQREGSASGTCVERELCKFSLEDQIRAGRKKVAIVFNLDKHTQSGSHWVSLWVDIQDRFIFYFDSAGTKIPPEIARLVSRIREQGNARKRSPIKFRFYENHPMEHQYGNTECGMYSLFFIITMLTGRVMNTVHRADDLLSKDGVRTQLTGRVMNGQTEDRRFRNSNEKIRFFRKHRVPDKYVENLRWQYFNE